MSPLTVGQIHSPTFTYPSMFSASNFSPQGNPKARIQIIHPEMASLLIYPDIDTFHDLPKVPGQSEFPGPPPKVQFNEAVYSPSYLASSPGLTYQATTFFAAANNYNKLTEIMPPRPVSSQSKSMTTHLPSWDWQGTLTKINYINTNFMRHKGRGLRYRSNQFGCHKTYTLIEQSTCVTYSNRVIEYLET